MDTGRAVVGRHDGGEYLLSLGDGARADVRDLDVLLSDSSSSLLVIALLRLEACPFLLPSMSRGPATFEGLP
jgi:hypothetical protein|tara:strand:- start:21682 stop:21897 length:216 start_codon:yes stop_codon:yes gene_type:complete